jgi:hypothetical protein
MRRCGIGPLKNKDGQAANLEDVLQELTDSLALYTNEDGYVYKIKRLTYRTLLFGDFEDGDTFSFKKKREELVFPLWLLHESFSYNMPENKIVAAMNLMKEKNIDINTYDLGMAFLYHTIESNWDLATKIYDSGKTILHHAIESNWDIQKIRFLLDNGADVNAQTLDHGWTPLHYAVFPFYKTPSSIIDLLLSRAECIYDFQCTCQYDLEFSDEIRLLFDKYNFGIKKANSVIIGLSFLSEGDYERAAKNEKFDFIPTEVNGHPVVGIEGMLDHKYDKHINMRADVKAIRLPATLKHIGSGLGVFYNARNIKKLALPLGLLSIGERAFSHCCIENIEIPDSVVSIGACAFENSKLKSIELSSGGIRTIRFWTFDNCTNLKKVVIHGNIDAIEAWAFRGCIHLEAVQVDALIPPVLWPHVFDETNPRLRIYVPDAAVEDYRHAENWSEYADRILPVSQMPQEQ